MKRRSKDQKWTVRVIKTSPILFIFILFSSPVSAFTPPSWFKNGTYVTYVVYSDSDAFNGVDVLTSLLSERNLREIVGKLNESDKECIDVREYFDRPEGLVSLLVSGKMLLTFNLTNVTNSSAVVKVTLELHNTTIPWCNIGNVTLEKELFLNLTDGYYYLNGTKLGRPSFFILPYSLPEKDELFVTTDLLRKHSFTCNDIKIANVSFKGEEVIQTFSDKVIHTFVKKFYPPHIYVRYSQFYLSSTKHRISLTGISFATYDLDTGVATSLEPITSPELLALGIVTVREYNYYSAKMNKKLDFSKEYWPYGFVLYKTNIQFPKEQTGKAPDTVLKYYLLLGLVILTASLLRRWKR
ncbi:hypothetical protein [Thermococcus sp. 21S7]|uniref:hypothetical protein n=1 Tax=Thermococcus sp. 21S7 TaxID=1638221 RepID=UPI00143A9339|nr:hypothetical protein [Thermococcus sp. 21S7]NJE61539.1 hypothetical protein [Thermococcus sp. 21S7]